MYLSVAIRKLLPLVFCLSSLFATSLFAQVSEPTYWEYSVKKISDTEFDLIFKGQIASGWHVYSAYTPEGGSLPMEITFENPNKTFELVGKALESHTKKAFNEVFGVDEVFFEKEATITQRIRLLDSKTQQIRGVLFYQVCQSVCINKEHDFAFCLDQKNPCLPIVSASSQTTEASNSKLDIPIKNEALLSTLASSATSSTSGFSHLLGIFVLGFLGGLLALLTPCVFPMIPLTVSFFTKHAKSKKKGFYNAVLYGVFIIGVYVALSIPFHFLESIDPEILNTISTNVVLNVVFFVVFVFFAFSFLGYYELVLPGRWGNRADSRSGTSSLGGIFFMALTLAIVSFSCTGPILGSLLAGSLSASGGASQLTSGMMGFGTALALPFSVFAMFPNLLKALPRSGGWLNTVKVVLGFLELALALKFLSNADLVAHWGLLKREVFIAIWLVLFVGLTLYLFKKIRFPHDSQDKKLPLPRIVFGFLVCCFAIYLASGLGKNASLKLLSGFAPPQFYSLYKQSSECPLGLNCFKDFEEGLAFSKAQNKPIMLDFTGWACVNCRKMEENVWSDPEIYRLINENYVLISLYVDDRKVLPEGEQFSYRYDSGRLKAIKTVGDKWATFQAQNFKTASQPFYVLMTSDFELLNAPIQYTDHNTYAKWLNEGLKNLKKTSPLTPNRSGSIF